MVGVGRVNRDVGLVLRAWLVAGVYRRNNARTVRPLGLSERPNLEVTSGGKVGLHLFPALVVSAAQWCRACPGKGCVPVRFVAYETNPLGYLYSGGVAHWPPPRCPCDIPQKAQL